MNSANNGLPQNSAWRIFGENEWNADGGRPPPQNLKSREPTFIYARCRSFNPGNTKSAPSHN
jgi:hypothetical protein